MESITVGYSRKMATTDYGSIGVSGSVDFKPASGDFQKEYDEVFAVLKLIVDAKLSELGVESGGVFDEPAGEPDLGKQPEWVGQHKEEVDQLLGRGSETSTPPPPPPPAKSAGPVQGPPQDQRTEDTSTQGSPSGDTGVKPEGGTVFLGRAKVFRSNMKRTRKGSAYAELRIGHKDLTAHINDDYVTVRIFDPAYAQVVGSLKRMKDEDTGEVGDVEQLLVHKNDFVDVWGEFSPWASDPNKFDMNATAIQKSQ